MNNITVTLNSSNFDPVRQLFSYKLIQPQAFLKKKVSLVYASIYKQWNNIASTYGNNSFTVKWIDGTIWNYIIPDGNYTIVQINEFIQWSLFQSGLYCNDANNPSAVQTFLEVVINPTAYSAQINFYPLSNSTISTALGYSIPVGQTWAFPTTPIVPTITFNTAFGKLIGFTAGTYGTGKTANYSINSNITPTIAIVNNLIINTNLINNEIANPNTIISAMDCDASFGNLLSNRPFQLYSNIAANNFSEITIWFMDQNFNLLTIRDPSVSIQLSICDQ